MGRFCYFRPNESALCKLCTSIHQLYLIWAAVICHVPPPKDQGDWNQQSKNNVGIGKKEEAVEVHDEVKLPKGEVRPANLNFNYNILVAVSTNIGLTLTTA